MRKASYSTHDIIRYLRYLTDYLLVEIKWQGDAKRCEALCTDLCRIIAAREDLSFGVNNYPEERLAVTTAMSRSKDTPVIPVWKTWVAQELDRKCFCLGIRRARSHSPLTVSVMLVGVWDHIHRFRKGAIEYCLVPNQECFDALRATEHRYHGLKGRRARLHG